ncbi:unnamed protein product, partial [Mesorhabditis belari]|uniref:Proteasome activator complex subunit 4 n=1 Tax=Mesorhabditis belari TaxID=2138241 RepID=A0AAF3EU48_9BILA
MVKRGGMICVTEGGEETLRNCWSSSQLININFSAYQHQLMDPLLVIEAKDVLEAQKSTDFHRPKKWLGMLPNPDLVERGADARLSQVTNGLAVALRENDPPAIEFYCAAMKSYIFRFSFRLPKKMITDMVPLLVQSATIPAQPPSLVYVIFETIQTLLQESGLTRSDMIISMKPLFDMLSGIIFGKKESQRILYSKISDPLISLKKFYSLQDVEELWKEKILPLLSPMVHGRQISIFFLIFMPTDLTQEEHRVYGASQWFPMIWNLFSSCKRKSQWTIKLVRIFYKLERDCPGLIDWRKYDEELFSCVLKCFQGHQKGSNIDRITLATNLAHLIAYRLGGDHSCFSHLQRILRFVGPLMHPSSDVDHTDIIFTFLQELTKKMLGRYRRERIKKHTVHLRSSEYHLGDEDLKTIVSSILPIILPSIFDKSHRTEPAIILKYLATFAPDMVLPEILKIVFPSLKANSEPHRLKQSLRCLEQVILLLCQEKSEMPTNFPALIDQKEIPNISIRCHVIFLLEGLLEGLDINDLGKTYLVVQIMSNIFYLVPTVDCTALAENDDPKIALTKEERTLCRLTARLPKIAENVLEKILSIVEGMGEDLQRSDECEIGADSEKMVRNEAFLRDDIDKLFSALFSNASKQTRVKHAHRIFLFVRSTVIAPSAAAKITQTLVRLTTFYVPEVAEELSMLICDKVIEELDEFTKSRAEKSNGALQWWSGLFESLLSRYYHLVNEKTREKMLKVIDDLLAKTDQPLYESGINALGGYLWCTSQSREAGYLAIYAEIDKPIEEWIPVRHWGELFDEDHQKAHWNVPTQAKIDFAQFIINDYFKKAVQRLKNSKDADSKALRRDICIVRSLFDTSKVLLPSIRNVEILMKEDDEMMIPLFVPRPTISEHALTLDGDDIREAFIGAMEVLIDQELEGRKDEAQLRLQIAQSPLTATNSSMDFGDNVTNQRDTVKELRARIQCEIHLSERAPSALVNAILELMHAEYKYFLPDGLFTSFHLRVLRILVKCSLSIYKEARRKARNDLVTMCDSHQEAKQYVIQPVIDVLEAVEKNDDQIVKAALHLICDLKLAAHPQAKYRNEIWKALLEMTVNNRPSIIRALGQILEDISEMSPLPQSGYPSSPIKEEREKAEKILSFDAQKFCDQLEKDDLWTFYKMEDFHNRYKEYQKKKIVEEIRSNEEFTKKLLNSCDSTLIHAMQRELAQQMLLATHHFLPTPAVLKVFLAYTSHDQSHTRCVAWQSIKLWLKINKPKMKKIEWTGPERNSSISPFACGIRSDNQFAAYAVERLPKDEETWNKTIFIKKRHGGYKWPSSPIKVEQGGCGLAESKVPEFDSVIIEFFTNSENIKKLMKIWTVNTNGKVNNYLWRSEHNHVATTIKYLIRNYEPVDGIQEIFTDNLKKLRTKKKKEEQRVAFDLFYGIVKGSRHHSFSRLEKLWSWLAPSFITLLDNIHSDESKETENYGNNTIKLLFKNEDLRRFWWLIEALVESINSTKTFENSWHYAFKTKLLSMSTWRETELRNRLIDRALDFLPITRKTGQREGIVKILTDAIRCGTDNIGNDFSTIPSTFQLGQIDQWIEVIYRKLADLLRNVEKSIDFPKLSSELAKLEIDGGIDCKFEQHLKELNQGSPISNDGLEDSISFKGLPTPPEEKDENLSPDFVTELSEKLSETQLDVAHKKPKVSPLASPVSLDFTISPLECTSLIEIIQGNQCDKAITYIRTLVELLTAYYKNSVFGTNEAILSTLPMILQISCDEPDRYLVLVGSDLKQLACTLAFEYIASHIDKKHTDLMLQTLEETFNSITLWKVKRGVLKFLRVAIIGNLFAFADKNQEQRVLGIVVKGLTDVQPEVQGKAVKCLMNLAYSGYFEVDHRFLEIFANLCTSSIKTISDGGLLAYCAIVEAFPFSCPQFLPKLITKLCSLPANPQSQVVKKFIAKALRDFRFTHRECWDETKRVLGIDLLYQVENACAPSYYA